MVVSLSFRLRIYAKTCLQRQKEKFTGAFRSIDNKFIRSKNLAFYANCLYISTAKGLSSKSMNKHNVIIAELYPCLIQGIRDWLSTCDRIGKITVTGEWQEVVALIRKERNTLLISTYKWIDAKPGVSEFLERYSQLSFKAVCLTDATNTKSISDLYHGGIQCLISMSDTQEEFQWGIRELMEGKYHISSDLLSAFLHVNNLNSEHRKTDTGIINFSKREEEILGFIRKGFTNKEIAEKLFISKRTVDGYRESILDKTGAKNTAQLISMLTGMQDAG